MDNTATPFDLPAEHRGTLPPARRDGLILADVKVEGSWDGILAIDENHRCVGVYAGREVVDWHLPFAPTDIEAYRKPCAWNRFLAFMPPGILSPYPVVWVGCPALIATGHFMSHWLLLAVPMLAFICIVCMYSEGGFPLTRMPSAMVGIALSIVAIAMFVGRLESNREASKTATISNQPAADLTHVGNAPLSLSSSALSVRSNVSIPSTGMAIVDHARRRHEDLEAFVASVSSTPEAPTR